MAGIIKKEGTASATAFSFQDLESYARQMLAAAKARASQMVEEAEARVDELFEQHRQRGYAQGLEEGRQAGREEVIRDTRDQVLQEYQAQLDSIVGALTQGFEAFEQDKRRLIARGERGLIELALAIARRVCKTLPQQDPDAVRANARYVLDVLGRDADVELHVSPRDYASICDWAAGFVHSCETLDHIEVVSDKTISPGGCLLRGRHLEVDATIEAQLDRIAAGLCLTPSTDPAAGDPSS